jgi:hypothetical protein
MTYATPTEFVDRFPAAVAQSSVVQQMVLEDATAWIDDTCSRTFSLEDEATSRDLVATDWYVLDLGRYEIGNATVTVAVDDGTGAFATTLDGSDLILEPVNALTEGRPYTTIRSLSGSWPVPATPTSRQARVRITARFGWPAVPATVREACLVLANDSIENPGAVRSEAIDGYSVTYSQSAYRSAMARLGPYRRKWAV